MTVTTQPSARQVMADLLTIAIVRYTATKPEQVIEEAITAGVLSDEEVQRGYTVVWALARAAVLEAADMRRYAAHLAGSHGQRNWETRRLLTEDPREVHAASHERSPHLNHKHYLPNYGL